MIGSIFKLTQGSLPDVFVGMNGVVANSEICEYQRQTVYGVIFQNGRVHHFTEAELLRDFQRLSATLPAIASMSLATDRALFAVASDTAFQQFLKQVV